MLRLGTGVRVYVALGATDMRKSFYTLAALVQEMVGLAPTSGHVFAFSNRARNLLKVLRWDHNGYCLYAKRLERGKFAWPEARDGSGTVAMTHDELEDLLRGVDVQHVKPRSKSRGWYDWHAPRRENPASVVRP